MPFTLLLLLLIIIRSHQLNVQLFREVCKSGESLEVHFLVLIKTNHPCHTASIKIL